MNKDVSIISLSDTHSGGLTALFPNYSMQFVYDPKNILTYAPTNEQIQLYNHWLYCAREIKERAKKRRKIIVLNGDAIEGRHHNTIQIVSPNKEHQSQIHIELMETLLYEGGFSVKNGDELHYVSGTETHTGWKEYGIAKHFEALGAQYHDELKKSINGVELWWVHEGPKPGKGVNEGNGIRNFCGNVYWMCIKEKRTPPHLITASHYHKAAYDSYNDGYAHTVHGQILPSWQMKTRYGQRVSPFERNDIGLKIDEIDADGYLRINPPLLMEIEP